MSSEAFAYVKIDALGCATLHAQPSRLFVRRRLAAQLLG
jgi:hypothetical protein